MEAVLVNVNEVFSYLNEIMELTKFLVGYGDFILVAEDEIQPGGKKSGPATILTDPNTGTKFRIHATPGEGTLYFRVQNNGGNYLNQTGGFPSNATKKELGTREKMVEMLKLLGEEAASMK
ncbi:YxiF family protein [Priestia koreensis]|uniref:YxiF family protein n=1 Tax=Priestia koreensis TaxID=284581 RepID=UPI003F534CE6